MFDRTVVMTDQRSKSVFLVRADFTLQRDFCLDLNRVSVCF